MKEKASFSERLLCPPEPGYAAAGDLLRVVSVLFVAWFHIWQQSWLFPVFPLGAARLDLTPVVRPGYLFVDLMLLLSGFLLYLPYADGRETSLRDFYRRRAARILPSYWFCLLVMLVFAVAQPGFSAWKRLGLDLAAHLSFTHNFFLLSYTATSLNVVLWTLAVEVQFYLIFPFLARLFRKAPLPCYAAMVALAFLCRALTAQHEDTTLLVNQLPNMLDVYANGMLAAHFYVLLARCERRRLVALLSTLAAAVSVWLMLCLLTEQSYCSGTEAIRRGQLDRRFLFSFCGAVFLLGGSLSYTPLRALCSNRVTRFLASVSYQFYIWHQWLAVKLKLWRIPPYEAASNPNQAGEQPWQTQYTLLCFFLALLLSILLTYALEKPCAKLWRGKTAEISACAGGKGKVKSKHGNKKR